MAELNTVFPVGTERGCIYFRRLSKALRRQLKQWGVPVVFGTSALPGKASYDEDVQCCGILTPVSSEDELAAGGLRVNERWFLSVHRDDVVVGDLLPGVEATVNGTVYHIERTAIEPTGDAEVKVFLEQEH